MNNYLGKHSKKINKEQRCSRFKRAICVAQNLVFIVFSAFYGNHVLTIGQFRSTNSTTLTVFLQDHFNSYLLSFFLCLLFVLVIDVFIGDTIIGAGIFIIMAFVLQFININKMSARQAPLYPEEIKMVSEARALSNMVDGSDLRQLSLVILLILFLTILFFVLKRKFKLYFSFKTNLIIRFVTILLLLIPLSQIPKIGTKGHYLDKFLTEHNIDVAYWGWNQPGNYNANGFVLGFVFNAIPQPIMDKPEGYSKEAIQKIQKKYEVDMDEQSTMNEKSNLIFILSESFIDPADISEHIKFSEDPIPYIHSLMKDSGGKILVSEYGGGTANMEFELLTGISTSFFSGIPYQDVVSKDDNFPSFIKVLKNNGYSTFAVHPYDGNMYKRSSVYPNLGIDNFLDQNDISHNKKVDNSSFISDESTYLEALNLLENNQNPMFINLITMQNHQPYSSGVYNESYDFENDLNLTVGEQDKIGTYIKGLSYTDRFTQDFIEKLNSLSTDTLVFFFGDHYPGQNVFGSIYTGEISDYLTPYFLYSTQGEILNTPSTTSLNYIQLQIVKQLGIQITPFMNLLSQAEVEWSAMSREFAIDNFGNTRSSKKLSGEALKDYKMITYDIVAGKKYSLNQDFYGN